MKKLLSAFKKRDALEDCITTNNTPTLGDILYNMGKLYIYRNDKWVELRQ